MRDESTTPRISFTRVNLLRAHGSPTAYLYSHRDCRCSCCSAQVADYNRHYREANREKISEHKRKYREAHRGEVAESARRSREKHPEQVAARHRCYHERHPGRAAQRSRSWYQSNPERASANGRARKSRKREAPGSHTAADVIAQRKRQRGRCFWCKGRLGTIYHVDHVVPLAKGGSDGPENIVIACPTCNLRKGVTHPMDFAGVLC